MSLLFDQNLARRLPILLATEFPGAEQVVAIGMEGADDAAIWAYAITHNLAIVSKDSDFAHLARTQGPPPKVIWLRTGNGPTAAVATLLRNRAAEIRAFLGDPGAGLLELP